MLYIQVMSILLICHNWMVYLFGDAPLYGLGFAIVLFPLKYFITSWTYYFISAMDDQHFKCIHTPFTKSYASKANMMRHYRHMHTDMGHKCSHCNHTFISAYVLNKHVQAMHQNMVAATCSICNKSFKWSQNLTKHLARFHGESITSANFV